MATRDTYQHIRRDHRDGTGQPSDESLTVSRFPISHRDEPGWFALPDEQIDGFRCPDCPRAFIDAAEFRDHIGAQHPRSLCSPRSAPPARKRRRLKPSKRYHESLLPQTRVMLRGGLDPCDEDRETLRYLNANGGGCVGLYYILDHPSSRGLDEREIGELDPYVLTAKTWNRDREWIAPDVEPLDAEPKGCPCSSCARRRLEAFRQKEDGPLKLRVRWDSEGIDHGEWPKDKAIECRCGAIRPGYCVACRGEQDVRRREGWHTEWRALTQGVRQAERLAYGYTT